MAVIVNVTVRRGVSCKGGGEEEKHSDQIWAPPPALRATKN